tara:strand:- start:1309 stop:1563 length:255 start_codon:yes stop_codon:yes gene_type:complete
MTIHKVNYRSYFEPLINAIGSVSINEVLADTGYDSHRTYKICEDRNIKMIIPPPRNAKQTYSKNVNSNRMKQLSIFKQKASTVT